MLILKSSNPYKIQEYKHLLKNTDIKVEPGIDLKEVLSDMDTVITYKVLAAGENVLVEDTVLIIDGKEEVEIRWKWQDLKTGSHIKWIISIGYLQNGKIRVFRGEVESYVDRSFKGQGEAFEPFIVPIKNNPNKTSYTLLSQEINKDLINPRSIAVKKLLDSKPDFEVSRYDVPEWKGQYQND